MLPRPIVLVSKSAVAACASAGVCAFSVRRYHPGVSKSLFRLPNSLASNSILSCAKSSSTLSPMASSSSSSASGCGADMSASFASFARSLTESSMNSAVVSAQYAVRGELVIKAEELKKRLAKPGNGLPFESIVHCNIGNPQELGQTPVSFFRQVLALCHYPPMLKAIKSGTIPSSIFPADAAARAEKYLTAIKGGTGAYSNSQGVTIVREEIAEFISQRDGHPSSAENIFLTDGASSGVKALLNSLIANKNDGVLIPIPQYPLYSATLTLCGGVGAGYYLDESAAWSTHQSELQRALSSARKQGTRVRALVIINPGNPTGQLLSRAAMEDIVRFCADEKLVLLADEVYQSNVYIAGQKFSSFKKVVCDLKAPVELVSFHSTSKGFLGECGQRGGYFECHNIDEGVRMQLYKLASISLCSNLSGQIMTGLMVNPPRQGDPSYEQYISERDNQIASLKARAVRVAAALNSLKGVRCNAVEGAMYAFPSITLSAKAIEAAKTAGKTADTFYCLELLNATGLCVVPGSGFGQKDGTWHFRTTILPPMEDLDRVMKQLSDFHQKFMDKYA